MQRVIQLHVTLDACLNLKFNMLFIQFLEFLNWKKKKELWWNLETKYVDSDYICVCVCYINLLSSVNWLTENGIVWRIKGRKIIACPHSPQCDTYYMFSDVRNQ